MIVLDTDVCIEILRGNQRVIDRRAQVSAPVATSWMSAAELYFGAEKSINPAGNKEQVRRFLATLPVLPPDALAARLFARLKADLQRHGQALADADLIIAATALSLRGPLVTGNLRHYQRIPGLRLEDWIRGE